MKTINWDEVKPQEITLEDLENSVIKPYTYGRGAWRCAQAMYKIYKQHPDYLDLDITARRPLEKGFDVENGYDAIMETTGFMYSWAENTLRYLLSKPPVHDRCSYVLEKTGLHETEAKFPSGNAEEALKEALK